MVENTDRSHPTTVHMNGIDVDSALVTLVTVRAQCTRARSALQAMGMKA